ncbi:hypothetical protein BDZ45DRAFT_800853 [Acephala macrosclerotiorum]|nr:hypothetical protein BDZ45DRAFT_800853 [Acephala macrosclerotiorum]
MVAEEERVVAVHSTTNDGLRAKVPPMLHVYALSRAVGLKCYKLSFGFEGSSEAKYMIIDGGSSQPLSPLPRIYFNFDQDILYFKEGWNEKADGPWSCINHLKRLLNLEDMQKVGRLGIDLVDQALDFIENLTGIKYGIHSGPANHMVLAEDFCEKVCLILVVKA